VRQKARARARPAATDRQAPRLSKRPNHDREDHNLADKKFSWGHLLSPASCKTGQPRGNRNRRKPWKTKSPLSIRIYAYLRSLLVKARTHDPCACSKCICCANSAVRLHDSRLSETATSPLVKRRAKLTPRTGVQSTEGPRKRSVAQLSACGIAVDGVVGRRNSRGQALHAEVEILHRRAGHLADDRRDSW
jgi:hypothetical protein